jgi:hypothetical protein
MSDSVPPFTPEQIRSGTPDGHTLDIVTTREGEVVDRRRTIYFDPDETSVSMRLAPLSEAGVLGSEAMEARTTWVDLRDHAVFPAETTTVTEETIDTPLGSLPCTRYDVASGEATMTYWFAAAHPGMPVRAATLSDGVEVEVTTVVAISRTLMEGNN